MVGGSVQRIRSCVVGGGHRTREEVDWLSLRERTGTFGGGEERLEVLVGADEETRERGFLKAKSCGGSEGSGWKGRKIETAGDSLGPALGE